MSEEEERCIGGNGVEEDCKQIDSIAEKNGVNPLLAILAKDAIREAYSNIRTVFEGVREGA